LFEFQQGGIDGALVELQQIAADLFDAAGDTVTVQLAEGGERLEDQ